MRSDNKIAREITFVWIRYKVRSKAGSGRLDGIGSGPTTRDDDPSDLSSMRRRERTLNNVFSIDKTRRARAVRTSSSYHHFMPHDCTDCSRFYDAFETTSLMISVNAICNCQWKMQGKEMRCDNQPFPPSRWIFYPICSFPVSDLSLFNGTPNIFNHNPSIQIHPSIQDSFVSTR